MIYTIFKISLRILCKNKQNLLNSELKMAQLRNENLVFLHTDESAMLRFNGPNAICHKLYPHSLRAVSNAYGETEHDWYQAVKLDAVEHKERKTKISIQATGINTCHTVLIKVVGRPIYFVSHTSAGATRRGYDVLERKALDVELPPCESARERFMAQFFRAAGPSRSSAIVDNATKPAYIEFDPAYYQKVNAQLGLHPDDVIDVLVVHTGIGFDQNKLIENLKMICSVRNLNIQQRDRAALNQDPDNNEFYSVTLTVDISNNIEEVMIKTENYEFHKEVIGYPFDNDKSFNLRRADRPVSTHERKEEVHLEVKKSMMTSGFNIANDEKYSLQQLLIDRYGEIPRFLKNHWQLQIKMSSIVSFEGLWLLNNELEPAPLPLKCAVFTAIVQYATEKNISIRFVNNFSASCVSVDLMYHQDYISILATIKKYRLSNADEKKFQRITASHKNLADKVSILFHSNTQDFKDNNARVIRDIERMKENHKDFFVIRLKNYFTNSYFNSIPLAQDNPNSIYFKMVFFAIDLCEKELALENVKSKTLKTDDAGAGPSLYTARI